MINLGEMVAHSDGVGRVQKFIDPDQKIALVRFAREGWYEERKYRVGWLRCATPEEVLEFKRLSKINTDRHLNGWIGK